VGAGLAGHVCTPADGLATMRAALKAASVRGEIVLLEGVRGGALVLWELEGDVISGTD
jgi:hypothetical protein